MSKTRWVSSPAELLIGCADWNKIDLVAAAIPVLMFFSLTTLSRVFLEITPPVPCSSASCLCMAPPPTVATLWLHTGPYVRIQKVNTGSKGWEPCFRLLLKCHKQVSAHIRQTNKTNKPNFPVESWVSSATTDQNINLPKSQETEGDFPVIWIMLWNLSDVFSNVIRGTPVSDTWLSLCSSGTSKVSKSVQRHCRNHKFDVSYCLNNNFYTSALITLPRSIKSILFPCLHHHLVMNSFAKNFKVTNIQHYLEDYRERNSPFLDSLQCPCYILQLFLDSQQP